MIVQRPQFDLSVIKKGKVFWLKEKNFSRYGAVNCACMVKSASEFKMTVTFYSEGKKEWTDLVISIDDVIDREYMLDGMGVI